MPPLLVREQLIKISQISRLDLDLCCRRHTRLPAYQGFHGGCGQHGLCLIQQQAQRLGHRLFAFRRRQVQNLQVLPVRPRRLRLVQHVVGQPKATRRKQLFPKTILRQCSRFPHQPIDHMPIIDPLFAPATQTRQLLHALLPVPHLQMLRINTHLDRLANQPAVHRIHVVLHPDQTAAADRDTQTLAALQTPCRQRPKHRLFFGKTPLTLTVAWPLHFLQEGRIRFPADKIPAAT